MKVFLDEPANAEDSLEGLRALVEKRAEVEEPITKQSDELAGCPPPCQRRQMSYGRGNRRVGRNRVLHAFIARKKNGPPVWGEVHSLGDRTYVGDGAKRSRKRTFVERIPPSR